MTSETGQVRFRNQPAGDDADQEPAQPARRAAIARPTSSLTPIAIAIGAGVGMLVAGYLVYQTWEMRYGAHTPQPMSSMSLQAVASRPVQTPGIIAAAATPAMPAISRVPATPTSSGPVTSAPAAAAALPSIMAAPVAQGITNIDIATTPTAANPAPAMPPASPTAISQQSLVQVPTTSPAIAVGSPQPATVQASDAVTATPLAGSVTAGPTLSAIAENLGLITSQLNLIDRSVQKISRKLGAERHSNSALAQKLAKLQRENAVLAASNTKLYGANAWLRHMVSTLRARLAMSVSGTVGGWEISGISATAAVLTGPHHVIKFVHVGSTIDGMRIVALHPNTGEVVTTRGTLRAGATR